MCIRILLLVFLGGINANLLRTSSSTASNETRSLVSLTPGWVTETGTVGGDRGYAVALDTAGNLYVTGGTTKSLNGQPAYGACFADHNNKLRNAGILILLM